MLNGSSAYGASNSMSVTGAHKPATPALLWWIFPIQTWRPQP